MMCMQRSPTLPTGDEAVKENNIMSADTNYKVLNKAPKWQFYLQHPLKRFDIKEVLEIYHFKDAPTLLRGHRGQQVEDGQLKKFNLA